MKKKTQWFLAGGLVTLTGASILTLRFIPEWGFLDFLKGLLTGMGLTLTLNGIVLGIRTKRKSK